MKLFKVTSDGGGRVFGFAVGTSEGFKNVIGWSLGRSEYVLEFGKGDRYDYDGYEELINWRWQEWGNR